jgi:hypothetical protein
MLVSSRLEAQQHPRCPATIADRAYHGLADDVALATAEAVQLYLDREQSEMSFDPKYLGIYDGRLVFLEDIAGLSSALNPKRPRLG